MYYDNTNWLSYWAQRAHTEYERAHRRSTMRRLVSALSRRSNCLISFEQAQEAKVLRGQRDRGLRDVPISRIVGSVGRYRDFDAAFNPVNSNTRKRWEGLYVAALTGADVPPVELYQLGNDYYVKDGNHRISVAKYVGVDRIEAIVTEYLADCPPVPNYPSHTASSCAVLDAPLTSPVL